MQKLYKACAATMADTVKVAYMSRFRQLQAKIILDMELFSFTMQFVCKTL